jgi:hypothetical protein
MSKKFRIFNILLISTLVFTSVAMAQDNQPGTVTLTGTVGGVGEGYIEFIVDAGESFTSYKVYPIAPLAFESLNIGDVIEISGYFNGEDLIAASDVHSQASEEGEIPQIADIYVQSPSICGLRGDHHPIAAAIAQTYSAEYQTVVNWICDQGYTFGEVIMALQTAEMTSSSPANLLAEKNDQGGWGQVWVTHGLISNERMASAPLPAGLAQEPGAWDKKLSKDKNTPPDHAQTPGGPDDEFVPPGQAKDKEDKQLPDNAGLPDGSGPPGQNKDKDKIKDKDK